MTKHRLLQISRQLLALASAIVGLTALPAQARIDATNPVAQFGALSINNGAMLDHKGRKVALSGVSYFWSNTTMGQDSFYNRHSVNYFADVWHASLVRVAVGAMGQGSMLDQPKANMAHAETVIDAAIDRGVYVLIDWHSHRAEQHPEAAVAFFRHMALKYGHQPNIIYEIYNEPLNDVTWAGTVKPYALTVIAAIRAIDPDNIIVVGSPTWSQDVDIAAKDPITGYDNIAYSMHFYAGTHHEALRAKTQTALDSGQAVFVTEWGTINANGDGAVAGDEVAAWMKFLHKNCLSAANWAVSNKAEGASIFKVGTSPTGPWSESDLTESGLVVRDIVKTGTRVCNK